MKTEMNQCSLLNLLEKANKKITLSTENPKIRREVWLLRRLKRLFAQHTDNVVMGV